MTAESAARELAIAIVQSNLTDADEKVIYFQRIITQALKQYGNERLEEASHYVYSALFDLTMSDKYIVDKNIPPATICYAATNAIEALKEPLDV